MRAVCGFGGVSGGGRSGHLRLQSLPLRTLLFAVFVERVHDVVQALIYDLAVAEMLDLTAQQITRANVVAKDEYGSGYWI